jgi:hypothetical protein
VTFCQSYPVYDPYSSSTALDTGYSMYLAYGKGECSGEYLLDTVILGGEITLLYYGEGRLNFKYRSVNTTAAIRMGFIK